MFKIAKKKYLNEAVVDRTSLTTRSTYVVPDVDRYISDDYAVNVSMQESEDKISIGVYITNYKVGISGYQEYWHFTPEEIKMAQKTYAKINSIVAEAVQEFEYDNIPMSILNPKIRALLDNVAVGYKERSGIQHFNWYTTDVEKEEDWRVTIYGKRYPTSEIETMNKNWNKDDTRPYLSQEGTGRDKQTKLVYPTNNS